MLRYGYHVLLALFLLMVQATLVARLFGTLPRPDLAFLVVIYLGLHHPIGEATLPVVVIAYLADRFTALPDGTFLLLYLSLFALASAASRVFYFRGTGFPALITFALSLLYGVALSLMVRYGRVASTGEPLLGAATIPAGFIAAFAALNVIAAVVVHKICRLVDGKDKLRAGGRRALM